MFDNWINKIIASISNWRDEYIDKKWRSKPHRCTCHVCGYTLTEKNWSPAMCGWMRLKGKIYNPWICHNCLEHHEKIKHKNFEECKYEIYK